jgi:hypothetical protein
MTRYLWHLTALVSLTVAEHKFAPVERRALGVKSFSQVTRVG